jgi:GT2 family glycosyltransferase
VDTKILIGLSTGENIRRAEFLPSFIGLERPPNCFTSSVHGQSPAKSRNIIIQQALDNECTHVFLVDDDMILPSDTLKKLLKHDKDIVTGLYLLRGFPHRPALFDKAYNNGKCKFTSLTPGLSGLVPAVNCGLGCVLIRTRVFREVIKPWVRLGEIEQDEWCDDVGFFNRCRKAGFSIWCDLDAPAGHMTNVTIWPEKHDNKWYTNYKHASGNIRIEQNILSAEEVKEQENKLLCLK